MHEITQIEQNLYNTLGLSQVMELILELGPEMHQGFMDIAKRLIFANQQVWANVQPVINQMISDLTNHNGDPNTICTQALAALKQTAG